MVTTSDVVGYVLPLIQIFVWGIVGLSACVGLWYWLFIIKKRKKWFVDIYEQKSDGKLHLVSKDSLYQKKINKGKQTIYMFKRAKAEATPPPWEAVDRYGNKEYCDYLRVQEDYMPMDKSLRNGLIIQPNSELKRKLFAGIRAKLQDIRNTKTTLKSSQAIDEKYIYVPLAKGVKYDVEFKPIPYDVNMMRINSIDNISTIFKDKQDWWSKWGGFVVIGGGIVMVIVIGYLGFEYMQKVVQLSMGAADRVAKPLEALVNQLTGKV